VQQPYQEGEINLPPGILSGQFYNMLKKHCFPNAIMGSVNCHELVMLHVGVVSVQYIVGHKVKLAKQLYEASGETQMNFVL
jgi:hypothetical protein